MKYKVTDNKRLNIYLTRYDLRKENVTMDDVASANGKLAGKIKKICKSVGVLTGFDINQSLNIVLMPVKDGDLIISVGTLPKENKCVKLMFVFDEFENLLEMCFEIKECKILTSIYKMGEKYYLEMKLREKYVKKVCAIASEYGDKIDVCSYFIAEHGKIIIKNCTIFTFVNKFFGI
jgi:negative regulator of genetic competence, sporulation and motility